jgi:hypothetical protein
MAEDIRDKPTIEAADVKALNFVNEAAPFVFRKHHRQGLRSHIMEILDPVDVKIERSGMVIDGVRCFPRARPRRMFRLFRSRLKTLDRALNEIGRVKIVEQYLAPNFMATSVECIVDYHGPKGWDLMLCGFQEYVQGEVLDPWSILGKAELLPSLFDQLKNGVRAISPSKSQWISTVRNNGRQFVEKIKQMMTDAGHIPDLAGAGNLILTAEGDIRLVDINNISRVDFSGSISLDEKGYPVCDKSVEALALIEEKIVGRKVDRHDKLFKLFLDPKRWEAVKAQEALFWKRRSSGIGADPKH